MHDWHRHRTAQALSQPFMRIARRPQARLATANADLPLAVGTLGFGNRQSARDLWRCRQASDPPMPEATRTCAFDQEAVT